MLYLGLNESEANFTLTVVDDVTNLTTSAPSATCWNNPTAFKKRIFHVLFYLFALVILSGLVLNTLAFVCFMTSHTLRRTTTGLYLIALTVADFTFLVGDFIRWLNAETVLGIKFYDEYNFWCKSIYFIRYFGKLVSAWITVAITVERFISVVYPLKANQLSTKFRTRLIIVTIYFCCFILTLFPFWTIGLQDDGIFECPYCGYLNTKVYDRWNWAINRVGSLFLPSIIIFTFTTVILNKLHQVRKRRYEITRHQSKASSNNLENQLTAMLILVAVAFLLLRLPYAILYYIHEIWLTTASKAVKEKVWAARKFMDLLATTNYSTNFFLFCLGGSSFRNQFKALMCCRPEVTGHAKTSTGSNHTTVTTAAHSRKTRNLSYKQCGRVV